ncbi:hypothetical protein [Streptomyces sp. 8N616]|uniref:hypothetical protein n=1 Tax=Streptomyces sp. 8N616 TaxID=3457414 RepID=UPI003FD1379A
MAGRAGGVSGVSGARRRAVLCLALVLALLCGTAALAGCGRTGGPSTGSGTTGLAIQRMLDRRADALLDRDAEGFLAAADPRATGYREQQRRVFRNLADVPLGGWHYRLVRTGGFEPAAGEGRRIAAEVRLRYRLEGYDTAPVESVQRLTVSQRDGRWYVAAEDPRSPDGTVAARQLWDQGEVAVVRGSRSLVLGTGQDARRLREIARTADRAVPSVDDAWRGRWAGRVVVFVPGSLEGMGELLGAPAAGYRGIAAVTTGEAGGAGRAPADRVIVNPEAYGVLGETGRRVVLTHETAHVATRAATSSATPLWLSEGFADWAGYRGTGRTAREIASELSREAAAGRLPRALPRDADFGFGGGNRLAVAYEGGWLACRMVADRWGEARLRQLYRAAGAQEARDGAVDRALREVLGVGLGEFTARWRAYAAEQLGSVS